MGARLVTAEDFVVAWATADTLEKVMQTTGMSKAGVVQRANYLRKKGVRLPKLTPQRGFTELRVAQLNSLINKYDIRKKQ